MKDYSESIMNLKINRKEKEKKHSNNRKNFLTPRLKLILRLNKLSIESITKLSIKKTKLVKAFCLNKVDHFKIFIMRLAFQKIQEI